MNWKKCAPCCAAAGILAGGLAAHAASLAGSTVSGTITPDNSDISVATQFGPATTIGAGTEFNGSISDAAFSQTFNIAANFSGTGLTVTFTSPRSQSNLSDGDLFSLSFSDSAFSGGSFSLTSYGCNNNQSNYCNTQAPPNGLISTTLPNGTMTLKLSYDNISAGQVYDFAFTPAAATPEPGSILLLGTGLLSMGGLVRRRLS